MAVKPRVGISLFWSRTGKLEGIEKIGPAWWVDLRSHDSRCGNTDAFCTIPQNVSSGKEKMVRNRLENAVVVVAEGGGLQ